jgi:HEAT repeat protein
MSLFGRPNGEKMIAKRDVEGLIKALGYRKDDFVRRKAAEALGQVGDARAVGPLMAALQDSKAYVRKAAAGALGQIGDARAVEPLVAALNDRDRNVRSVAGHALDKMGWQPGQDEEGGAYWVVKGAWDKCIEMGAPAVAPLIAVLKDSDSDVRKAGAWALGKIGDARAAEPLIAALKDRNKDVRKAATKALGQIGDARGVEPLVAALKDTDLYVRYGAADALGQIGDARAVEPLIAALKDSDARWAVAEALGHIGDARAIEPLIAALKNGSSSAGEALGRIGDARAVAPLIAALKDGDWHVRGAAAEALGKIGDARAVKPLIPALKDGELYVLRAAADALDKMGWRPGHDESGAAYWVAKREWKKCIEMGKLSVDPLIAALKNGASDESRAAGDALGQIGDARAVEPLIAALGRRDWSPRTAAAESLFKLYRSAHLNRAHKSLILAQRGKITSDHGDENHSNCGHTDYGIGVEFPV